MKDNYEAWCWDYKKADVMHTLTEKIHYSLEAGILAPSIHNTQPWKFKVVKDRLTIFPDVNLHLVSIDKHGRDLLISLGCCITNIQVAAAFAKLETKLNIQGDTISTLKICITFVPTDKKLPMAEYAKYIVLRSSNKSVYIPKQIESQSLKRLNALKINSQHNFTFNHDYKKADVINIHKAATLNVVNKVFIAELSKWIRSNLTNKYDGMPGFVLGMNPLQTALSSMFIKHLPKAPKVLAKKDAHLLGSSSGFGVITGPNDGFLSYIDVGRLYELIALSALSQGLVMSPMHAIINHTGYSEKLKKLLSLKIGTINFFYRIGYGINPRIVHTPRKKLHMVLE